MPKLPKLIASIMLLIIGILINSDVYAQVPQITKLYLKVSPNTTILKSGEEQNLLVSDYLSSNRVVIEQKGAPNTSQAYLPFGESTQMSNSSPSDREFTGHRKLESISGYHAGARFYQPVLGQFTQPDQKEGPNRYAYVNNNPISLTDPTGNEAKGIYAQIPDSEKEDYENPNKLTLLDGTLRLNSGLPLWKSYTDKNIGFDYESFVKAYLRTDLEGKTGLDYVRSLAEAMNRDIPYNSNFDYLWSKEEEIATQKLFSPKLISSNQEQMKLYKSQEDLEWVSHREMTLMEKLMQGKFICTDFASYLTYALAQKGIPSAIVTNPNPGIHHAFNLVEIEDKKYIVDATWHGMVEELNYNSSHGSFSDFQIYEPYGKAFTQPFFRTYAPTLKSE
ncbi:MAG: RHS repeat-associated core domain-containing protein [Candidatus Roizmanbacteria bacterium]